MTSMKTYISVIVPVYNAEKHVKRCLDSLIEQSFSQFEVIIINDGSIDNSAEICESYTKKCKNFTMIKQVNQGVGYARNVGIRASKGKYIMFLDSDDYLDKYALETMYQYVVTASASVGKEADNDSDVSFSTDVYANGLGDVDMLICGFKRISEDEHYIGEHIPKVTGLLNKTQFLHHLLSRDILVSACSRLLKASVIKENNLEFCSIAYGEDYLFNLSFSQVINHALVCDYNPYYCRYSLKSAVTTFDQNYILAQAAFAKQLLNAINGIGAALINDEQKADYMYKELSMYVGSMFSLYQKTAYKNSIGGKPSFVNAHKTITLSANKNNTLILFGASTLGFSYLQYLYAAGYDQIVFTDNDHSKWNTVFEGCEVISPSDIEKYYCTDTSSRIIITSVYFVEILEQLLREGIIKSCSEIMPYEMSIPVEMAFVAQIDSMRNGEYTVSQDLVNALLDFAVIIRQ